MPVEPEQATRPRVPVTRRTLVRGAAWSVPAIAVCAAAPAYAASCTSLYPATMDWGQTAASTYTRSSTAAGSGTAAIGGAIGGSVRVDVASAFTNYTALTTTPNLGTLDPVGGTGNRGLTFTQAANSNAVTGPAASGSGQSITFTFSQAVYNLSFLLTDLDYNATQYHDAIAVTSGAFTFSVPAGSTVIGNGTTGAPFRTSGTAAFDNNTGNGGNVQVSFAGPITTFRLQYWNYLTLPTAANLQQGTWMAPMTFQTYNVGC